MMCFAEGSNRVGRNGPLAAGGGAHRRGPLPERLAADVLPAAAGSTPPPASSPICPAGWPTPWRRGDWTWPWCPRSSISATPAARSSPTPASPARARCGASSSTAACRWSGSARLALDEGSRTSAALVRIWLKERFGLAPAVEPLPIGAAAADCAADAVHADRRSGDAAAGGEVRGRSGTWARSGRAGPGCPLSSPCGWPGPARHGTPRARRWGRPATRASRGWPRSPGRPPRRRHPRGRLPLLPPRSPHLPPGGAAAAGTRIVFRVGQAARAGRAH